MHLRNTARASLALLALVASPLTAVSGAAGRVTDRSGDPVPAAVVHVRCGADAPFELVADDLGRFELVAAADSRCVLVATLADGAAASAEIATDGEPSAPLLLRLDVDLVVDRIEVQASPTRDAVASREIRESFARDAGEAISRLPGVAMLRKGGLGSDLVLRGQKRDDVEVRIDGHRIYGACPNRMDPPAFHVDFAEIERIDVAKGPFDVARGGLAGVVDIVTREPEPGLHVEAQAAGGSASYLAPSLSASYATPGWSARAGAALRRGDPYSTGAGVSILDLAPPGSASAYVAAAAGERAFDVATGWGGVEIALGAGHRIEFEGTRQEGETQLYPYLQMDARLDNATRASAQYRYQGAAGRLRSVDLSVSRAAVDHDMDDRLRVSGQGKQLPWSMATHAESEVLDERLELVFPGGLEVGADAWQREWRATTRMAGMGYRPQQALADATLDGYALWGRLDRPLGDRLRLRAGARAEGADSGVDAGLADTALYRAYHGTASTSGSDAWLAGNVGLAWSPTEDWELAATLGSATRAPDPQERYFALRRAGSDWVGNPELAPARNDELDLGARFHRGAFSFDLDLFAANVSDAVTLVEVQRQEIVPGVMNTRARSYVNHDERRWGFEASARWTLSDRLLATASASYLRGSRDLAPELGVEDRDLPEMPPPTARLALRYDPGRWFAEAEGVFAARQDRVDSGLNETPTPGWGIANLRGGLELGRFSLIAGVDNLLDRDYLSHLSYQRDPFRSGVPVPEPGRTLTASLRYRY